MSTDLASVDYTTTDPPGATLPHVRIADVIVGDRARKDHGDLTSMMDSIREGGVLQPIVLRSGNRLLFGGRRLEACRRLGVDSIPFVWSRTREDALSLLRAERDENTCRKDMTPEELVDVGLRIEEIERPHAEARQAEGQRLGGEIFAGRASGSREPEASQHDGKPSRTALEVGAALDMGAATYKRAKHVVQIARGAIEAPPEVKAAATDALKSMNETGNITGAYHKVRKARAAVTPREPVSGAVAPKRPGPPSTRHVLKVANLRGITARLSGYQTALDQMTEIDHALTSEEAALITGDLSKSIAALQRLNRLIKERTK